MVCTQGRGSGRRPRGALLDGEAVHLVAVHAQAARAGQALVAVRALEVLGLLVLDQRRLIRKLAVAVEAPGLGVLLFLLFPHHCARRSQTDGRRRLIHATHRRPAKSEQSCTHCWGSGRSDVGSELAQGDVVDHSSCGCEIKHTAPSQRGHRVRSPEGVWLLWKMSHLPPLHRRLAWGVSPGRPACPGGCTATVYAHLLGGVLPRTGGMVRATSSHKLVGWTWACCFSECADLCCAGCCQICLAVDVKSAMTHRTAGD